MSSKPRFPLVLAVPMASELVKVLSPFCERIQVAGSIRRRQQQVGDIELVVIPKKAQHPGLLEDVWIEEDLLGRESGPALAHRLLRQEGRPGPDK